jgi:hypothetical protein
MRSVAPNWLSLGNVEGERREEEKRSNSPAAGAGTRDMWHHQQNSGRRKHVDCGGARTYQKGWGKRGISEDQEKSPK